MCPDPNQHPDGWQCRCCESCAAACAAVSIERRAAEAHAQTMEQFLGLLEPRSEHGT